MKMNTKENMPTVYTPLTIRGKTQRPSTSQCRRLQLPLLCCLFILFAIGVFNVTRKQLELPNQGQQNDVNSPLIIIVTPTYKRITRLADMLRCTQTLMLVKNIFWIVVEDNHRISPQVDKMLNRSGIPYTYLAQTTEFGWPKKGWSQRNRALDWITDNYSDYDKHAVVYFMDDDNAYDYRLFDRYIRKVKKIGIWAVGLVGDSLVEAPHVTNGIITSWDVFYSPKRDFAVDMAGFALGLPLILQKKARLYRECAAKVPETCLLKQFGMKKEEVEPFGWETTPKEVLVWHVKTKERIPRGTKNWGYDVETLNLYEINDHKQYFIRGPINTTKADIDQSIQYDGLQETKKVIQKDERSENSIQEEGSGAVEEAKHGIDQTRTENTKNDQPKKNIGNEAKKDSENEQSEKKFGNEVKDKSSNDLNYNADEAKKNSKNDQLRNNIKNVISEDVSNLQNSKVSNMNLTHQNIADDAQKSTENNQNNQKITDPAKSFKQSISADKTSFNEKDYRKFSE